MAVLFNKIGKGLVVIARGYTSPGQDPQRIYKDFFMCWRRVPGAAQHGFVMRR
ncbi:MAG: hypothetical protein Q8M26_08005 [Pseudolabrys sp.]|nr:hypothetical protein [Pseudolabrys sp.]